MLNKVFYPLLYLSLPNFSFTNVEYLISLDKLIFYELKYARVMNVRSEIFIN